MGQYKKLWCMLVAVLIGAFSILGYYGFEVYREAPPIPQHQTGLQIGFIVS